MIMSDFSTANLNNCNLRGDPYTVREIKNKPNSRFNILR